MRCCCSFDKTTFHQRQGQDDKTARHTLSKDREDHQRPFMPSTSISHLLRVGQIAGCITARTTIGVRFDDNTGFAKCADGSGATAASSPCFLRSSSIGPKSSARSGQDSTQIGFYPRQRAGNSHHTWSYALSPHYTAAHRTGRPYGNSDSRCTHLHQPRQTNRVYA